MSQILSSILLLFLIAAPTTTLAKKHHGVFCDVCKDLVDGGEKIGDADLDAWLDTNIQVMCWTLLLPLHHECEEELKKVKKELKKSIEDGVPPKKACEDVDLC